MLSCSHRPCATPSPVEEKGDSGEAMVDRLREIIRIQHLFYFILCVPIQIFWSVSTNESLNCNNKRCRNERSVSASCCQNSLENRKRCIRSLLSEIAVWAREWAASAVLQPHIDMCAGLNHSFTYGAISCPFFWVSKGCSGCGPSSFPRIHTSHWQIILSIISFLLHWLTQPHQNALIVMINQRGCDCMHLKLIKLTEYSYMANRYSVAVISSDEWLKLWVNYLL